MTYLKISLIAILAFIISGCATGKYDYTIHKPRVLYKPSLKALDKLNRRNLGKKYVWAEEGPYCYDCSGLTYFTYGSMGIEIPRVAREQFKYGTPVAKSELKKGDLVFFDTGRYFTGKVTHVGIYLGNGKFEHASSSKKRVIISSLNNPYYMRRYLGARRVYSFNNYRFKAPVNRQMQINSYIANSTFKQKTINNSYKKPIVVNSYNAVDEDAF
jgi:hypothetical protein